MHGVRIIGLDDRDGELRSEGPPDPVDAELVGDMAALHDDVLAEPQEIGGVEDRLELGHRPPIAIGRRLIAGCPVELVEQLRSGRRRSSGRRAGTRT